MRSMGVVLLGNLLFFDDAGVRGMARLLDTPPAEMGESLETVTSDIYALGAQQFSFEYSVAVSAEVPTGSHHTMTRHPRYRTGAHDTANGATRQRTSRHRCDITVSGDASVWDLPNDSEDASSELRRVFRCSVHVSYYP